MQRVMCKVYTSLRDNIYQQMIDRMILFVTRADSRRSGMTSLCGQGSVPVLYRLTRQSLSHINNNVRIAEKSTRISSYSLKQGAAKNIFV